LPAAKVAEICRTADVFINISESTFMRDEYLRIPKKVLIDSDPMFTQVQFWNDDDPAGSAVEIAQRYGGYDHLFTFGENIGRPDCMVPAFKLNWIPTRQPICLQYWHHSQPVPQNGPFTTVMNWSTRTRLRYGRQLWGQKDIEFEKIGSLPQLMKGMDFQIVASCSEGTPEQFRKEAVEAAGWTVLEPSVLIPTAKHYQAFIRSSLAEFSVAKETYVKSNSGWFSCRSACYLASGRPVITQETAWSRYIPAGEGLFAFQDIPTAVEAISRVSENPRRHAQAARDIAAAYFDSHKVLQALLEQLS
jgi:hypothetical protein